MRKYHMYTLDQLKKKENGKYSQKVTQHHTNNYY